MLRFVTAWGHQLSKKSLFLAQSAHHQSFTDRPVGRLDSEAAPKGNGISRWSSQAPKVASKYLFPLEMFTSWAAKKKSTTSFFLFKQNCRFVRSTWKKSGKVLQSLCHQKMFHRFSCFSTHVLSPRPVGVPLLQLLPFTKLAELSPSLRKKNTKIYDITCVFWYIYI